MLKGYRVLDLTNERGLLCGKMLADLGAEVVKVEPIGGDPSRNKVPFYHDNPNRENSLYWFAYNLGKKSITLNLESEDGKVIFKQLINDTDFLIESFDPGYLGSLGLSYTELSRINPRLIMTSITPFGQTGPYKNYKGPDIVVMALSGGMHVNGEPDREPLCFSLPFAFLHASSEATVGTLIANYYRGVTGRGQHVDQSAQQSVIFSTHNLVETWDLTKSNLVRSGNIFTMRPPPFVGTRLIFKCKDGYVNYPFNVGSIGAKNNPILIEWMRNDGINVDEIEDFQWDKIDMLDFPKEMRNKLTELVQQFFLKHTKKELYEESTKRRLLLYPVFTMEDLVNDPQLEFRNFWEEVSHPLLKGAIKYPHPCALLIGIDPRGYTPPPYIGEHNMEIYQNLGLSKDEIISLQAKGVI